MKKFVCDKCGLCCQSISHNLLYKELDNGEGVCRFYDKKSHLCSIYNSRPKQCDIEAMYKYFSAFLTKEAYYELNKKSCEILKGRYVE